MDRAVTVLLGSILDFPWAARRQIWSRWEFSSSRVARDANLDREGAVDFEPEVVKKLRHALREPGDVVDRSAAPGPGGVRVDGGALAWQTGGIRAP